MNDRTYRIDFETEYYTGWRRDYESVVVTVAAWIDPYIALRNAAKRYLAGRLACRVRAVFDLTDPGRQVGPIVFPVVRTINRFSSDDPSVALEPPVWPPRRAARRSVSEGARDG